MPRIIGPILDVEDVPAYPGTLDGTRQPKAAFTRLHVLDGREVSRVNARSFKGQLPTVGEIADLQVEVFPYVDSRNNQAGYSYSLVEVLDQDQVATTASHASNGS